MSEDDEKISRLEKKRYIIMELNSINSSIEHILSRISDEEIVRLIREDRETDHGREPKEKKGDKHEQE